VAAADLVDGAINNAENESFATLIAAAPPNEAGQVTTQKVGSVTYTVTTTTYWQPETTTQGGCDNPGNGTATGLEDVLLVEATVTWHAMLGTPPVRADTLITPPGTVGSPQDGNFAVQVQGPAPQNAPVANFPVSVAGPSGTTVYDTDANGCLFLGYENPGQYTFTLTQPGWVGNQETTTDTSGTVNLTAGQTQTVPFDYSSGATITGVFTGTAPAPIGLPISVANSALTPAGTYVFSGGATSVTYMNLTPLWPYANGYQVFAGRCPEANPAAVFNTANGGGAMYASSLAAPTAAVTAGATTYVNVPLYPLTVNLTSPSGATVDGYTVDVAEQAGLATTSCGPLDTYNLVGLTAGTKGTLLAGMPLGHFTVGVLKNGSPVQCNGSPCTSTVDITGSATTASVTIP
jgi:hypothetical protein